MQLNARVGIAIAIVFVALGTLVLIAALAPRARAPRAGSVADGVPVLVGDDADLALAARDGVPIVIRDDVELRPRMARGSVPPPAASLVPAHVVLGELNARIRAATPMPTHDDGWEMLHSVDDAWD